MAKIRVQPKEIEAPAGDPFKHDRLQRETTARVLTRLISSIEGPCTLAVDAVWGNGKTSFLKMWTQYLRDEGFPVVEFNAWKTDFTEVPFLALSAELTDSFKEEYGNQIPKKINAQFTQATENILWSLASNYIYKKTAGIVDIGKLRAALVRKKFAKYTDGRNQIKEFENALQKTAEELSKQYRGKPLVVMVDELDRCRPTYAVEFLETAKHLFAVDNIVFVLAVNREQLAHSVRALYGGEFGAEKYLYRFFDVDFRLPAADRINFIDTILNEMSLKDHLVEILGVDGNLSSKNMLINFFQTDAVSLRDIGQAIHRMGLVFASLPDNYPSFSIGVVTAVILRTVDLEIYKQLVGRTASDKEVVDTVFERHPEFKALRYNFSTYLFEAAIIVGSQEIRDIHDHKIEHSELWKHYKTIEQDENASEEDKRRAKRILRKIDDLLTFSSDSNGKIGIGFKESVERFELFSSDLMPESESGQE